jgi:hypothetical protein
VQPVAQQLNPHWLAVNHTNLSPTHNPSHTCSHVSQCSCGGSCNVGLDEMTSKLHLDARSASSSNGMSL